MTLRSEGLQQRRLSSPPPRCRRSRTCLSRAVRASHSSQLPVPPTLVEAGEGLPQQPSAEPAQWRRPCLSARACRSSPLLIQPFAPMPVEGGEAKPRNRQQRMSMPAAASSAVAGTTLSSPEAQPLAAAAPLEADLKFDLKYFPKNLVQQGHMLDRIVWVVHVQGQCRVVGCIEAVLTEV